MLRIAQTATHERQILQRTAQVQMTRISFTRIASVVIALHLLLLSFFVFRPPAKYFLVTCIGTIVVCGLLFSIKMRKTWVRVVAGLLLPLATQQAVFQFWRCELPGVWWPLVQFLSFQYLVVYSFRILLCKPCDTEN